MESNDYWTHVGLAAAFFVLVVGPRVFSPGHTANSVTYVVGATVVVLVATFARYRTRAASDLTSPPRRSVREEKP